MTQTLRPEEWADRFAMALGPLLPGIDPTDASARAKEVWDDAHDLAPEEAAEIYALELPPEGVGAAVNS